jgi:type IV secretion system protein TrbF
MFFSKEDKAGEKTAAQQIRHNPYLQARQEWLERYGDYIAQAKNWRIASLLALGLLGLSLAMNFVQASQAKIVPYIVEVDKLGRAAVVARADRAKVLPERLIQSAIASCITDWRTVTADLELQRKMIEKLSFFFAGAAKGILKEWYSANNPYEIAKKGNLVQVEIKSLPLPIGGDSYRVEWTETVRNHSGVVLKQQNYEATVSIHVEPPVAEAVLVHNPGGIYITAISASTLFK